MFLANLPFRTAQLFGDRASFADETRQFIWSQSLDRIRRLAGGLGDFGHGPVAVLAHNSIEYMELCLACTIAGRVFVPMNTRLARHELRQLLGLVQPDLLFVDASQAPKVAEIASEITSVRSIIGWGGAPGTSAYEALLAAPPIARVDNTDDKGWAIIFTGGTTGPPKGVRITRRGMAHNVQHLLRDLEWGYQPNYLQVTPLFHLAALGPSFAVAGRGGCQRFLNDFSIDRLLQSLARDRIEVTSLVPTMINWLVNHPGIADYDLSALRAIAYGAAAIPEPVLRKALTLFPGLRFNQFYGQTEASGSLTTLASNDHVPDPERPDRLRSAGRAIHGVQIAIRDENGEPQPAGTWGEICALTPGLFAGYLGYPELSMAAVRDGWLRTGDIGFLDQQGYLYVTDRLKDMIVTGGENVSSTEVESVIAAHPAVAQVAVFAVPDPVWGERVHASIIVHDGAELSQQMIIAHCRAEIAGYKCPKSVEFRTEPFPLSPVGKIRKDLLRQSLRADAP